MNQAKILIVEDEFIVANDIEVRLLDLGYVVAGKAASGPIAIDLAGSVKPDLVLMDIRLQGSMDGITAAAEIRQRFHLPIVFLTAFAEDDTLQRAKEAEPFGYVLKPFEDRELRTNIEIALYKHKSEWEIGRLNRLYATLSQVNQAIVRVRSLEELFPKICQIALEFGQFKTAWIGRLDAATGVLVPIAKAGEDAGIVLGEPVVHCGCTLAGIQQGQPCLINDLSSDPRTIPCRELAEKVGLRACAAYPIRLQNQVCGVFVVGTAEAGFFNDAETRLLTEIALDISFALDTLETERERREFEAGLEEREQRLRTILDTALDGFWLVDTQGKFLEVNDVYCVMSGYTREEMLQMHISEVESAETEQKTADHIRRIMRQGGDRFETRHHRKDGKVIDVEVSVTFQNFDGGRFVCFLRDITERKQAEGDIQRLSNLLNQSQAVAKIGGWELNLKEQKTFWTDETYRLHETSPEEFTPPAGPSPFLAPEWEPSLTAAARKAIEKGEGFDQEVEIITAKGRRIWVHVVGRAIQENGRTTKITGSVQDIDKRKRLEQEREVTIEFLRLVNASTETLDMIRAATDFFQEQSGCEAVGIRLREGDDYPYFETRGFSKEFVLAENNLCARDDSGEIFRDHHGDPVIECMCGNVICGRFDPSKPFFTAHGSFWANDTTRLLASTTDAERQSTTRNRCNGEGYESVALIPLQAGEERLGLLQLNDRRKGQFSPEIIALWERLADQLAVALAKFRAEASLRKSEQRYRSLFENMSEGLARCKMLFDDHGSPVDFVYLDVNDAFGELTGLKNVLGKKVSEVIPGIKESNPKVFEIYGRVALTGQPERFEIEIESLGKWFSVSAYGLEREHFVAVFDNITDRKRAEEELHRANAYNRSLVEASLDPLVTIGLDGKITDVNAATEAVTGCARAALIGTDFSDYFTEPEKASSGYQQVFREGLVRDYPLELRHRDGRITSVLYNATVYRGDSGDVIGVFAAARDITERKRAEQEMRALEEQFRQAQKLEAVGRLAGGIAHDFNNHLMVIRSFTEMLQDHLPAEDSLRRNTQQVIRATERAASLTRQMLAFSRKQVLSPRVLDLNVTVNETEKMLKRLIGEDIELTVSLAESLWAVKADPDQIVQVLMNLCVNARDAMPRGGKLTLATSNIKVGEGGIENRAYIASGDYVMLSVADTGTGISVKVQEQMFDPFFTTKEAGKGTGLGLSTVYGIVKQSGGFIWVNSELGRGACFTIYLPGERSPIAQVLSAQAEQRQRGTETLLVVEDEGALRESICDFMSSLGYTVLAADSGTQALSIAREHHGPIDLLITDVVMPKMSGRVLSQKLARLRPDLKTIFMSGYTDDAVVRHGVSEEGVAFLQKPFSLSTLARKVRDVVGSPETLQ